MDASIPTLVAELQYRSADTQAEAARALGFLAANTTANRVAIARAGGIEPLVALVRGGSANAQEEAACALGHVALNNADNQAAIVLAGGKEPLVALEPVPVPPGQPSSPSEMHGQQMAAILARWSASFSMARLLLLLGQQRLHRCIRARIGLGLALLLPAFFFLALPLLACLALASASIGALLLPDAAMEALLAEEDEEKEERQGGLCTLFRACKVHCWGCSAPGAAGRLDV